MSFIPGMTGIGSRSEGIPPLLATVTKIAQSLSFAQTVAWPLGHQEGDLVLLYDWCRNEQNGNDVAAVTPAGFTNLINIVGNSGEVDPPDFGRTRAMVSYRILDGSEPSVGFITGMVDNRQHGKIALLFRGDIPIQSVTMPQGLGYAVAPSNLPQQTITAAAGVAPLIVFEFAAANAGSQLSWSVQNPAMQELVNNAPHMTSGYFCYPRGSAPINHIIDGFTGSGNWYGLNMIFGYLQVR